MNNIYLIAISSLLLLNSLLRAQFQHYLDRNFFVQQSKVFTPYERVYIELTHDSNIEMNYTLRLFKIKNPEYFYKSKYDYRGYSFDHWNMMNEVKKTAPGLFQFLREWSYEVKSDSNKQTNNVDIGRIDEPGFYLVQIFNDVKVSYAGIVVSQFSFLTHKVNQDIVAVVVDNLTGNVKRDFFITVYEKADSLTRIYPDGEGIIRFRLADSILYDYKSMLMVGNVDGEIIIDRPDVYFYRERIDSFQVSGVTSQPVYKPGQEIKFNVAVRQLFNEEWINYPNKKISIRVNNYQQGDIFNCDLQLDKAGTADTSFIFDEDNVTGSYQIYSTIEGKEYFGYTFTVKDYVKPEYNITVTTDKRTYLQREKVKGNVNSEYYFGEPMRNAQVSIKVYKGIYKLPWWFNIKDEWVRNWYNSYSYYSRELSFIDEITGATNDFGEFDFEHITDEDPEKDFVYTFSVNISDASGGLVSKDISVLVTRSDLLITGHTDRNYYKYNQAITLDVSIADHILNPVQRDFQVEVKRISNYGEKVPIYDNYSKTISGKTDEDGNAKIKFKPELGINAKYEFHMVTFDPSGRKSTNSEYAYVGRWSWNENISGDKIQIVPEKMIYNKFDTLNVKLIPPVSTKWILVTYETDGINKIKLIKNSENDFEFSDILNDKNTPEFSISACFLQGRIVYKSAIAIAVIDREKFLNVELTSNKEIYNPGDTVEYKVLLTNYKDEPVADASLTLSVTDLSLFSIQKDFWKSYRSAYFQPSYWSVDRSTSGSGENLLLSYSGSELLSIYDEYLNAPEKIKDEPKYEVRFRVLTDTSNLEDGYVFYSIALDNSAERYSAYSPHRGEDSTSVIKEIKRGFYDLTIYFNEDFYRLGVIYIDKNLELKIDLNQYKPDERNFGVSNLMVVQSDEIKSLPEKLTDFSLSKKEEDENYKEALLRKLFKDNAYWNANLTTDENGEAIIKFVLPDNLGKWRIRADVITKDTEVGLQYDTITVRKNILARIETPTFLRKGDETVITTIFHNYLGTNKNVKVVFNSEQLSFKDRIFYNGSYADLPGDKSLKINIPAKSSIDIDWFIEAEKNYDTIKFFTGIYSDEESDEVETTTSVLPANIPVYRNFSFSFIGSDTSDSYDIEIPQYADLKNSKLKLWISRTLISNYLSSLDYLIQFPYGCTEQTISRFLPAVMLADNLSLTDSVFIYKRIKKLKEVILKSIDRLCKLTNKDGGWGWWKNDNSNIELTSFALIGLKTAKHLGYYVNDQAIYKASKYLEEKLNENINSNRSRAAFSLYSLTLFEKNPKTQLVKSFDIFENYDLNIYALALLSLASSNLSHIEKTKELNDKIYSILNNKNDNKNILESISDKIGYANDNYETLAWVIKAFIADNQYADFVDEAVNQLILAKSGDRWISTKQTAIVLSALNDYIEFKKLKKGKVDFELTLNNRKILSDSFDTNSLTDKIITIDMDKDKSNLIELGKNVIHLDKKGIGRLIVNGSLEFEVKPENIESEVGEYEVERKYYLLQKEWSYDRIIYNGEELSGEIRVDDYLLVNLKVDTRSKINDYFIVEDMLPSGFEVVKDYYKMDIRDLEKWDRKFYFRPDSWNTKLTYWEVRQERTVFFVTQADSVMEFNYVIQAKKPGKLLSYPIHAYLMYYPNKGGYSKPQLIEVRNKD